MIGTVMYDSKSERSTTDAYPLPQEPEAYLAQSADLHVAHELVAIANGADYCLCGSTWPCEKRAE